MANVLTLPHGYISKSQTEMFLRCPRQYEYRYIAGLKEPPGVSLIQGICVHGALDMNNKHKIKEHEDLPAKLLVEKFTDDFETQCFDINQWEEPKDVVISESGKLINEYMIREAPLIQPLKAEEKIEGVAQYEDGTEIKLVAIVDVMEENQIGDYKVTGRKKSKPEVDGSLQLGLETFLTGIRNTYLMLLLKKKFETYKQVHCVTDSQISWTLEVIRSVAKAISAGNFPVCDPCSWACSATYCGYHHRCRGKH